MNGYTWSWCPRCGYQDHEVVGENRLKCLACKIAHEVRHIHLSMVYESLADLQKSYRYN